MAGGASETCGDVNLAVFSFPVAKPAVTVAPCWKQGVGCWDRPWGSTALSWGCGTAKCTSLLILDPGAP